jgi:hypothetical protein
MRYVKQRVTSRELRRTHKYGRDMIVQLFIWTVHLLCLKSNAIQLALGPEISPSLSQLVLFIASMRAICCTPLSTGLSCTIQIKLSHEIPSLSYNNM